MIPDSCPLKPRLQNVAGRCARAACNRELPVIEVECRRKDGSKYTRKMRRPKWCSDDCGRLREFWQQHYFPIARDYALARDRRQCVRCGSDGSIPKDEKGAYDALRPPKPPGAPPESAPHAERMAWTRTEVFEEWSRTLRRHYEIGDALHRKYQLEVNHKAPALGAHAEVSCIHHLDNLETLCGPCHRKTTSAQARERADVRRGRIPLLDVIPLGRQTRSVGAAARRDQPNPRTEA